ncbi:MAG: glycosyltransferase [Magnetococcales bacterium]|nr:glycosyltransferase [Magnetococcales bacterium]
MPITPGLLATLDRLDTTNDTSAWAAFLQDDTQDPNELVFALYHLLLQTRLRPAYILAAFLAEKGIQNPFLSIALGVGGLLFHNPEHEAYGLAQLTLQADQLLAEQPEVHDHIYKKIIEPTMTLLLASALPAADHAQTFRILSILQAFSPHFRTLFDWNAPIPEFSLAEMRRRGQAQQSLLLHYPLPPPEAPRPRRRVLVVIREYIFPDKPWSRPFDMGPRMVAAMNAYGWSTDFFPLKGVDLVAEAQAIVELCRQTGVELLFLDDDILLKAMPLRTHLLAQLRQVNPSIKVVGCLIDSWEVAAEILQEGAAGVDLIWATDSASRPVWTDPALADKVLHLPIPSGTDPISPAERPLTDQPHFSGSISGYNWHRAFWVAAFERVGLPVQTHVATHATDGLSALDSYALYMRQLAEATSCINLTMRANQTCTVTFRSFETLLAGSLLVQEASPSMVRHFILGEHYLEFSTLAELIALMRFVRDHRAEAEAIRQRGHRFAQERYNDAKLIGYWDKALFFPEPTPVSPSPRAEAVTPASPPSLPDSQPLLALAHTLRREQRLEDAQTLYTHLLALDPDNLDAMLGCAAVLGDQGSLPDSLALFIKIKEIAPELAGLEQAIQEVTGQAVQPYNTCLHAGAWEQALLIIEGLAILNPDNPFIRAQAAKTETELFTRIATRAYDSTLLDRQEATQLLLSVLFHA